MADIALLTADKVEVVVPMEQFTGIAAEAIEAGAPVRLDTSSGKLTNANGTTAPEARIFGIALKSVPAGMAVTVMLRGILDGYALAALAYDAPVYLSDTDGRLGDGAGTVSTIVGRVVPGHATTLGTAADKLLFVKF
jgi:hypothetical protein